MRKLIAIIALEGYAILLTLMQVQLHVRTDEAKYLLNIPYPHPPLARWILHTFDSFTYQEWFWRFVFASLLVQAVWLAVSLVRTHSLLTKLSVATLWLVSMGIVLQGGSIMMAPLTALEAWVFVWLYLRNDKRTHAGMIGLFWLFSLFTAYQAVLFFPLVMSVLYRQAEPLYRRVLAFTVPVMLLFLYTLTNPLVIASVLIHGDHDIGVLTRTVELLKLWLLSGSVVLSIVGVIGIVWKRLWAVLFSLLIVAGYISLARFSYYGILFLPLSMAGCIAAVRLHSRLAPIIALGVIVGSVVYLSLTSPDRPVSPARSVLQTIAAEQISGVLLINGSFGHEWQYESHLPIRRYNPSLLADAGAIICLTACPDVDLDAVWRQISTQEPFIYIR